MTAIPDDIMRAARGLDAALGRAATTGQIYEIIARAIMAERERAAKVVEMLGSVIDHPSVYMGGPSREASIKVAVIATEIRKGAKP